MMEAIYNPHLYNLLATNDSRHYYYRPDAVSLHPIQLPIRIAAMTSINE